MKVISVNGGVVIRYHLANNCHPLAFSFRIFYGNFLQLFAASLHFPGIVVPAIFSIRHFSHEFFLLLQKLFIVPFLFFFYYFYYVIFSLALLFFSCCSSCCPKNIQMSRSKCLPFEFSTICVYILSSQWLIIPFPLNLFLFAISL